MTIDIAASAANTLLETRHWQGDLYQMILCGISIYASEK